MKTPIEFDYDLWTTEDGKCMVRVKCTGEVTEVSPEVLKLLRAEERQVRKAAYNTSNDTDNGKKPKVFSYDALPVEGCESLDLADATNETEAIITRLTIESVKKTLTPNQLNVFEAIFENGMSAREYARDSGKNHKSVLETVEAIRKKFQNIF